MSVSSEDDFAVIHCLMEKGNFAEVVFALVDARTGRINRQFRGDLNHAWYCVADSKYRLGDIAGALPAFRKALKANPGDAECLLAIANCYDALKKAMLAERLLHKALMLNPRGRIKAAVLVNLGNALMDQCRWTEAIEYFSVPSKRKDGIGAIARKNRALALDLKNGHEKRQS